MVKFKLKTKGQGFTLLELLVTITLLGIVGSSLVAIVVNVNLINGKARDQLIANAIAEEKIETLRSIGFVGISDGTVNFEPELPSTLNSPRSAQYTVSSVSAGLKKIQVSISYNDHGKTKNLEYISHVGELGVGQ